MVPDCDEQPEIDGELCRTHEAEDMARERAALKYRFPKSPAPADTPRPATET